MIKHIKRLETLKKRFFVRKNVNKLSLKIVGKSMVDHDDKYKFD